MDGAGFTQAHSGVSQGSCAGCAVGVLTCMWEWVGGVGGAGGRVSADWHAGPEWCGAEGGADGLQAWVGVCQGRFAGHTAGVLSCV